MPNLRRLPPAPSSPIGTVATFDPTVPGSYAWEQPISATTVALSRTGPFFFDVTASPYNAVGDGATNDTAAVQAAINAAGAVGGGTIIWPAGVKTLIKSTLTMPARGSYGFLGAGAPSTFYLFNDGFPPPNPRASGIIVNSNIANQPAGLPGNLQCVLDFTNAVAGECTFRCENMLWYDYAGLRSVAMFMIGSNVWTVDWNFNTHNQIGVVASSMSGGGTQGLRLNLLHNVLSGAPLIYMPGGTPFGSEIAGNVIITEPTEGAMSGFGLKGMLQFGTFFVSAIHDNYFQGGNGGWTTVRAWIWVDNLGQDSLGSIHHNEFFGSSSRAIHWQNNTGEIQPGSPSAGVSIDSNLIVGWNEANLAADTGAAIVVLSSSGTPPAGTVHIGTNTIVGGKPNTSGASFSFRGIQVDGILDAQHVTIDPIQNMNHILTAPFRLNGIDYGKGTRSVTDGVTNGTATVTSATAAFVDTDTGQPITGSLDIPAGTYVGIVNSPTSIGLSSSPATNVAVVATGSHSGVTLTLGGTSHRFQAAFTAPGVPATATAIINPFGIDAIVDITAGAGSTCAVAVNGVTITTIAASGLYSVVLSRGATIKLTYTSAPTWVWRGA